MRACTDADRRAVEAAGRGLPGCPVGGAGRRCTAVRRVSAAAPLLPVGGGSGLLPDVPSLPWAGVVGLGCAVAAALGVVAGGVGFGVVAVAGVLVVGELVPGDSTTVASRWDVAIVGVSRLEGVASASMSASGPGKLM